jgi:hypothetical protein
MIALVAALPVHLRIMRGLLRRMNYHMIRASPAPITNPFDPDKLRDLTTPNVASLASVYKALERKKQSAVGRSGEGRRL